MRIGIDARLLHYQSGGISQYTRWLVAALGAQDGENRYWLLQMHQHQATIIPAANFERADCWTPCHHWLERWALSAEIAHLQLDVLHSPDFIPPAAGYRRSVITVHDLNFLHFPGLLTADSRRYYVDQIAWAVRRARRVIAVSRATHLDLRERLGVPDDKISVVYEAAGAEFQPLPPESTAAVLARYGLAPGYVLFVGTLEPRKNLPALLEAYAALRADYPDAPPLVLAGRKGWLFQDIFTAVARFDLGRTVRFIERFAHEDLPGLYNGAAVLIVPSLYEGFGLPALEAMQCGTPVIVSRRAALPEVVGDAGLLVDPEPDDIGAALSRMLHDSGLRDDLRALGLARARQFSWNKAARETLAQYQAAASSP